MFEHPPPGSSAGMTAPADLQTTLMDRLALVLAGNCASQPEHEAAAAIERMLAAGVALNGASQ